jgi:hypothetical protein
MTPRRPSRLVAVLLVAFGLLAAAPGLAAPAPERAAVASAFVLLQELWAELTSPFTSLFAASGSEVEGSGTAPSGPSSGIGTDDPYVEPQNGHQIDPNG